MTVDKKLRYFGFPQGEAELTATELTNTLVLPFNKGGSILRKSIDWDSASEASGAFRFILTRIFLWDII